MIMTGRIDNILVQEVTLLMWHNTYYYCCHGCTCACAGSLLIYILRTLTWWQRFSETHGWTWQIFGCNLRKRSTSRTPTTGPAGNGGSNSSVSPRPSTHNPTQSKSVCYYILWARRQKWFLCPRVSRTRRGKATRK